VAKGYEPYIGIFMRLGLCYDDERYIRCLFPRIFADAQSRKLAGCRTCRPERSRKLKNRAIGITSWMDNSGGTGSISTSSVVLLAGRNRPLDKADNG
jgi:hypothetical protein